MDLEASEEVALVEVVPEVVGNLIVMKRIKLFLLIFVLFGLGVVALFLYVLSVPVITKETTLFVREGDSPSAIWQYLSEKKLVKNDYSLLLLSKIKRFEKAKIGHYRLNAKMSANEVINMLRAGRQTPIKVTFNNIRTLEDFSGRISQQLEMDSISLLKELRNEKIIHDYGFGNEGFMGMFIPNTYEVYYTIKPRQFIDKMHREYKLFWNVKRSEKLKELGYTAHEVSTLASIIDEESNKNDEKRRIAGVYINRLKKGMLLQADPTLKFALGDFTIKRILNKHKEIDSPYNTYKNIGLPPGPIRQPSIVAIDAVLNYEKHRFLFFCAKSDFSGYHTFARTLNQHNVNARKYHNALNRRGVMR